MFNYWLRSHPEANWDHLVKALKSPSIELNYLAENIQRRFSGKYMRMYVSSVIICCASITLLSLALFESVSCILTNRLLLYRVYGPQIFCLKSSAA